MVMAANRFSRRKPSNPEGWFLCKRGPGPHRWTAGWNRSRSLITGSFSSIESYMIRPQRLYVCCFCSVKPFCCLWPECKASCTRQMCHKRGRWLRLKRGWQWKLDLLSFLLLIVLLLWFGSWSVLDPFASLQLFLFPPLLFILASMMWQIFSALLWLAGRMFCCGKCPFEFKIC